LYVCRPERYYFHHRRRSDIGSLSQITRFLPARFQVSFERISYGTFPGFDSDPPDSIASADTSGIRHDIAKLWSEESQ